MNTITKWLKDGGSKYYEILGTKFLITWKTHLNKEMLKNWLSAIKEIEDIYISHHLPDNDFNYEHTTCVICFKHQLQKKRKDSLTYENIEAFFKRIISTEEAWNAVLSYVKQSEIQARKIQEDESKEHNVCEEVKSEEVNVPKHYEQEPKIEVNTEPLRVKEMEKEVKKLKKNFANLEERLRIMEEKTSEMRIQMVTMKDVNKFAKESEMNKKIKKLG
jgi:hypothetical protein